MDWLSLPPLSALRAFAAFAEHKSMSRAGQALNVSHAAVSQQVRALEGYLGLTLVDRSARQLALTDAGQRLADALSLGFSAIAQIVDELTGADADRPLQVTTTPLFAATWLMPRLPDFQARHPGIDLMLNPTPTLVDLGTGGVDIALRFGDGDWPGFDVEMLLRTNLSVIGAPSLVGDRDFTDPAELLDFPWFQQPDTGEAQNWLRSHGVTQGRMRSVIEVPGDMALHGVRAGHGLIVTTLSAVEPDVAAGRLRVLFSDTADSGYFILTRPGPQRPPVKAFVKWLRGQSTGLRQSGPSKLTVS